MGLVWRLAVGAIVLAAVTACGGPGDDGSDGSTNSGTANQVAQAVQPLKDGPTDEPPEFQLGPRPSPLPSMSPQPESTVVTLAAVSSGVVGPTTRPMNTKRPTSTRRPSSTPRPTNTPRPTKTPRDDSQSRSDDDNPTATHRPGAPTNTPGSGPPAPTEPPPPTEDTSLLGSLRRGGHVIYLRHTRTDWNQSEREEEWVEEVKEDMDNDDLYRQCDRQRLLTDEGRDQARQIGEEFRRLGIPVGRVLSSPWCRTQETAQLAFGKVDVARGKLFDTGYLDSDSDDRKRFRKELKRLLSERPSGGTNTILVGHMPQNQDETGISLGEGQATIVQPEGGDYEVLEKKVSPNGWAGLARR